MAIQGWASQGSRLLEFRRATHRSFRRRYHKTQQRNKAIHNNKKCVAAPLPCQLRLHPGAYFCAVRCQAAPSRTSRTWGAVSEGLPAVLCVRQENEQERRQGEEETRRQTAQKEVEGEGGPNQ